MGRWEKCGWGWLGLCVLLVAASLSARAAVLLDQSFDPTGQVTVNAGIAGFNANQERAQTFRVGRTGLLTRVDIFSKVFAPATGSLIMDIRGTVAGGAPDPAITPLGVLSTASVPATSMPGGSGGFVTFALNTPLPVTAGTTLAIDLHASPGASTFGLLGTTGDPYPFGKAYEREITNHGWGSGIAFDIGFQTFVETVPLPTGLSSGTVIAVSMLAARRCRSGRRRVFNN
jgi:hypothetical protein